MKMRLPWIAAALLSIGLYAARPPLPPFTTTPSGLQFVDMRPGRGRAPRPGQICKVLYRGWLYNDKVRGALFDSAQDRRNPFRFPLGQGHVIPGWDEGIATMKPGGMRVLIVPPALGYGDRGAGGAIPPGSTLLFEVQLLSIE
jgi:peptidylprolyl isomerase